MSAQLQQAIAAAHTLSPRDKLKLLETVVRELQQADALSEASAAFWSTRSLDEIAQTQSAPVVTDIHALVVDFWPEDETADDINQFIAERRHTDRAGAA
ncbi:MAG: hypothetical protein EXS64_02905 [Candidatus Latescibacteria bacterium]|nr:hypothetical protein [Candidatus Latescibacterota bacterium]